MHCLDLLTQQAVERVPGAHVYQIVQRKTVIRRALNLGPNRAGPVETSFLGVFGSPVGGHADGRRRLLLAVTCFRGECRARTARKEEPPHPPGPRPCNRAPPVPQKLPEDYIVARERSRRIESTQRCLRPD